MISKKTAWIRTKLKEQSERPCVQPKQYVSGETFAYLGKHYRLKVVSGKNSSVKLKKGYLVVTAPNEENRHDTIRSLLENWYQAHAEVRLKDKSERLAKVVGVSPSSVAVKTYKSRWGSCSIKGDLTYNWKIILMPHRIIDYVVIHELCHLLEHNHSPQYWKHVERHIPDWKDCRRWLKSNPVTF